MHATFAISHIMSIKVVLRFVLFSARPHDTRKDLYSCNYKIAIYTHIETWPEVLIKQAKVRQSPLDSLVLPVVMRPGQK